MRLFQYITEGRTKEVEEKNALKVIHAKCMKHVKAIKSGARPHIYRGIRGLHIPYGIVDVKSGDDRKSRNTTNHMTLLMDNLPSWNGYPKRGRSAICSTDSSGAESYGTLYYVYPTDECDIGIVPASDVWDGFYKTFGNYLDVPGWNRYLKDHKIPDNSWTNMKSAMIKFYEIDLPKMFLDIKRTIENSTIKDWAIERDKNIQLLAHSLASATGQRGSQIPFLFEYIVEGLLQVDKGINMPSIINKLNVELSPEKNNFHLNSNSKMYGGRELWVGNGYIVVVRATRDMQKTLENEGLF